MFLLGEALLLSLSRTCPLYNTSMLLLFTNVHHQGNGFTRGIKALFYSVRMLETHPLLHGTYFIIT